MSVQLHPASRRARFLVEHWARKTRIARAVAVLALIPHLAHADTCATLARCVESTGSTAGLMAALAALAIVVFVPEAASIVWFISGTRMADLVSVNARTRAEQAKAATPLDTAKTV